MRHMGNLERILVFGILVVIGLILVVAIRGAREVEAGLREQQAKVEAEAGDDSLSNSNDVNQKLSNATPTRNGGKKRRNGGFENKGNDTARRDKPASAPPPATTAAPLRPVDDDDVSRALNEMKGIWSGDAPESRTQGAPRFTKATPLGAANPEKPGANSRRTAKEPGRRDNAVANPGKQPAETTAAPRGTTPPRGRNPAAPRGNEKAPAASAPQALEYVVKAGDTLEGISRKVLGDGSQWKAIMAANPSLTDPRKIRPGQRLRVPEGLAPADSSLLSRADSNDRQEPKARTNRPDSSGARRLVDASHHRVQRGDTLMSIALNAYGSRSAWRAIYDANSDQLPSKDKIRIGQLLVLPASAN